MKYASDGGVPSKRASSFMQVSFTTIIKMARFLVPQTYSTRHLNPVYSLEHG